MIALSADMGSLVGPHASFRGISNQIRKMNKTGEGAEIYIVTVEIVLLGLSGKQSIFEVFVRTYLYFSLSLSLLDAK